MRIDSARFAAKLKGKSKDYRFVVGIILDVDSIYLTSHSDISGVPGTVINSVLREPIISSQRLNPDEARAEIGTASFSILDKAKQFTDEVRERLNDRVGMRGKECRFYIGYAGDSFSDMMRTGTQILVDIVYDKGAYAVECADIQRALRQEIMVPVVTTLASTVTAGDTTIAATDSAAFQMVYHGDSYTDAPNTTVGYFKLKNTIYRYTGISGGGSFTGCVPVFGTVAETVTIDPAVSADRREKITEYIYLELPAVKLALALLTGDLYSDGASLPAHWHMGIASQWVTESDFLGIGTDLWNPATDVTPGAGYMVRFEGLTKTDGKSFLEKEIYLLCGLFSPVYSDGSLGLKRMQRIGQDAAHSFVLDNSNSIQVGPLRHAMKSVHNVFLVAWSWNGTRFNRATKYVDVDSVDIHGKADDYARSFKGLHGSIHTDAAVFSQIDMMRDRYAGPPIQVTVDLLDSMNGIEVGDVGRGRWAHIRDFAGPEPGANDPGIDRAFEVQSISCNYRTGVTVELFGSTARADVTPPTEATFSLPDGSYDDLGTSLSSAPGITIVGGVVTVASQTLAGNAALGNSGAVYYHTGNLTIGAGVTLNISQNVQLRIRGFLQINGTINGIGRGRSGVADGGQAIVTSWTIDDWINDRPPSTGTIAGSPGYVGSSRGNDGVYLNNAGTHAFLGTRTAAFTQSMHNVAPVLSLRVDSNTLLGLPEDLRGTGGAPGGRVGSDNNTTVSAANRGGAGANGGAGLLIVCRGMALGANGLIDLSGADSASPTMTNISTVDLYPGAGGAGGPGALYVLLDGSGLSVPDLGTQFRAYAGEVPRPGNALTVRGQNGISLGGQYLGPNGATEPVSGFADPSLISEMNFSGAALRIQYVPASQTPQGDSDSAPPPLTNLSTVGVVGAISVLADAPPPEQWDVIDYYAAVSNDRSGATRVNQSRATTFNHAFATATTRYYWGRTRLAGRVSAWYPVSATAGVPGTSIDASGGGAGESVEVQFSVSASGPWHGTFATGDLYMRTRVGSGGAWQGPWRVVGEDGEPGDPGNNGNVTSFIFRRSATVPATPTGNSPSGWSDSPPSSDGNPLWVSRALKTPAGILVGSWSTPTVLVVDGEDGEQGLPGIQGPGLFDWVNPVNVEVTATSIRRSSGGGAYTAGAYSQQSFSGGCFFTCRAGQVNARKVIGFNDDPAVDSGIATMNRALVLHEDGNAYIATNGTLGSTLGTYTTSDVFGGVHDGASIQFYKNGNALGAALAFVGRLFLDISIYTLNGSFLDVHFGASGTRGPAGPAADPVQRLELKSTAQTFAFPVGGGAATPASITFTAERLNIANATVWSTVPNVTLTGTGDTRVLTSANFGGNNSVQVTAAAAGFEDVITIIRLTQGTPGANGQPAISGHLTNENHTLVADPDGTVAAADLVSASGYFIVYEGIVDVTASATFSVVSTTGCTVQLNTAINTPVNGQPRGFYRLTAISADQASARLQASINGVTLPITFTVTKARQGEPGDGRNLLPIGDWVVGTSGNQGPGGRWNQNGTTAENTIVLGGAGTAPLGPFGTSVPLWQCRAENTSGTGSDGGWNSPDVEIDHRRSYRSTVWFRINQNSGSFYHGCRPSPTVPVLYLNGNAEPNPYFSGVVLGNALDEIKPGKWYLSVGIIHGSSYTGLISDVSGIYDPETGRKVFAGLDFKSSPSATLQMHRCYHFYDTSTATRQWMPEPVLEELNGSEAPLDALMGFSRSTPWIARGFCIAGPRTFLKNGGGNTWSDSDIRSAVGYPVCHLQFKAAQVNSDFMIGLSDSPGPSLSYEGIRNAWYPDSTGQAYIYESGVQILNSGPYTPATQFGIQREANGQVRYFKDGEQVRIFSTPGPISYLDSSFFRPGGVATNVAFGPGLEFELINTNDMAPNAATEIFTGSNDGLVGGQSATLQVLVFTPTADGICEITGNATGYTSNPSADGLTNAESIRIFTFAALPAIGQATRMIFGNHSYMFHGVLAVTRGVTYTIYIRATGTGSNVTVGGGSLRATVVKV